MDGSGCYVVLIFNHPPLGLDRCKDGFQLIQVVTKLYPLFGGHVYSLAIERVTEIHHPKKGTRRIARVFSLFGASLVFELFSVFWAWKFWEIWFGNCETKTRTRKRNWVVKKLCLMPFSCLDPTSATANRFWIQRPGCSIVKLFRTFRIESTIFVGLEFWGSLNFDKFCMHPNIFGLCEMKTNLKHGLNHLARSCYIRKSNKHYTHED